MSSTAGSRHVWRARSSPRSERGGMAGMIRMADMTAHGTWTDMNVLLRPDLGSEVAEAVRSVLTRHGASQVEVELTGIESACEPDNMLLAEYQQRFDSPAISEQVHRLTVSANWPGEDAGEAAGKGTGKAPSTADITAEVAGCLPPAPDGTPGLWFGQTSTLRSSE